MDVNVLIAVVWRGRFHQPVRKYHMKQFSLRRLGSKLALLTMLALPELASAQLFNYNSYGDVLAGFRKVSPYAGNYELVVDLEMSPIL